MDDRNKRRTTDGGLASKLNPNIDTDAKRAEIFGETSGLGRAETCADTTTAEPFNQVVELQRTIDVLKRDYEMQIEKMRALLRDQESELLRVYRAMACSTGMLY